MAMTLAQLETFVRVAEVGNFTRVADELDLTQPAVARQVHTLEEHFGVTLVDVVGRRLVLTDAGRFLAGRAGNLVENVARLEQEMAEFALARAGELRLGATLTIGVYALAPLLARFRAMHNGVRLRVFVGNTATTVARLHGGRFGLALVEGPVDDPAIAVYPYQDDHLLLALPPTHRFAGREVVAAQDLVGEPFIWRERGSGTRALAEQALARIGVRLPVTLELPTGEGVARAVEAGLGLAILSALVIERSLAERRLAAAAVAGVDLRRTFRAIHLRERALSPAARAFTAMVADGAPFGW